MGSKKRGNIRWLVYMWISAFLIFYLLYYTLISIISGNLVYALKYFRICIISLLFGYYSFKRYYMLKVKYLDDYPYFFSGIIFAIMALLSLYRGITLYLINGEAISSLTFLGYFFLFIIISLYSFSKHFMFKINILDNFGKIYGRLVLAIIAIFVTYYKGFWILLLLSSIYFFYEFYKFLNRD